MVLKVDVEAKTVIESLCRIAMNNTSQQDFLQNMAVVSNLLLKMELLPADKPNEPPKPNPVSGTQSSE